MAKPTHTSQRSHGALQPHVPAAAPAAGDKPAKAEDGDTEHQRHGGKVRSGGKMVDVITTPTPVRVVKPCYWGAVPGNESLYKPTDAQGNPTIIPNFTGPLGLAFKLLSDKQAKRFKAAQADAAEADDDE